MTHFVLSEYEYIVLLSCAKSKENRPVDVVSSFAYICEQACKRNKNDILLIPLNS
jgi:hypothetical protein